MILNKDQIYVLDDESGVRLSLETILSSDGFHVKSFACGTDLLNHLNQISFSAPAVALLDLRLPDMSGVKVMQKLREKSPETEVVMFTGQPDMNSAIEAVNAGAYAYVLKPYNMDEIKHVLSKIFEKQKLVKENKELTRKLQEWNKKLNDEVHDRTLELQESYRRLQGLYALRTQFITVMSHELRTPSTALMGFADTLLDRWEKLPKEKIEKYLKIISTEAARLVSLMSEIFEISRIQEGKVEKETEEVDLNEMIQKIVEEFRKHYPEYSFGFRKTKDAGKVQIHPLNFKTALSHILMNAIKYTPGKGNVLVLTDKKDNEVLVQVEDEGAGIPSGLEEKVFEPFFRLIDDVNRRIPGAGLGLSIARGIMDSMNGTIKIGNKITGGKGCAVVLTIPVSTGLTEPQKVIAGKSKENA